MKASTVAPQAVAPRPWVLALGGVVLGAHSAMCGIGGGVFAVPWLVFGFGLPMPQAVANSLVLVAASTSSATAFEALHPERALHVPTIVALVLSALHRDGYSGGRAKRHAIEARSPYPSRKTSKKYCWEFVTD